MRIRLVGAALWMLASCGLAQTDAGGARYLSQAELLNQAKALLVKARTDPGGKADIMLATYRGTPSGWSGGPRRGRWKFIGTLPTTWLSSTARRRS